MIPKHICIPDVLMVTSALCYPERICGPPVCSPFPHTHLRFAACLGPSPSSSPSSSPSPINSPHPLASDGFDTPEPSFVFLVERIPCVRNDICRNLQRPFVLVRSSNEAARQVCAGMAKLLFGCLLFLFVSSPVSPMPSALSLSTCPTRVSPPCPHITPLFGPPLRPLALVGLTILLDPFCFHVCFIPHFLRRRALPRSRCLQVPASAFPCAVPPPW